MNFKRKLQRHIMLMTIISSFTLLCIGGLATYAAYLNDRQANISWNTNSDLSKAFGGGIGTQENPYQIHSLDHLENLRRITNMGVLSDTTYFKMTSDIDGASSDKVLAPIGTYNTPFISKFDGNGKTLKNLTISSYGYDDVGIFGYVGCGGVVKNFLVDNISIVSEINTYPDENYLSTRFTDEASLYSQTSAADITIDTTNLRLSFAQKVITDKNNRQYQVSYRINDSSLFNKDGTLIADNSGANNIFYTSIDALVFDTYYDDTTGQVLYCSYVVQRYLVFLQRKTNKLTFFANDVTKPDNPVPMAELQFVCDANGRQVGHHYYVETDNAGTVTKEVINVGYVGLVVGNLDGDASYIGVSNSSLTVSTKEQISFFTIVGRTPAENKVLADVNGIYYQNIDFSTLCESNGNLCQSIDKTNFNATQLTTNVRTNDPITFMDNINDGIEDPEAFKFMGNMTFNTTSSVNVPMDPLDLDKILEVDNAGNPVYTYDDILYSAEKQTTMPNMVIKDDLNAQVKNYYNYLFSDRRSGIQVNNGLFVWASYNVGSINFLMNLLQNIFGFGTSVDYKFRMEINYSVNNCQAAAANNTHFMIQRNTMQVNAPTFLQFDYNYTGSGSMDIIDTYNEVFYTTADGQKTQLGQSDYTNTTNGTMIKPTYNINNTDYDISYDPQKTVCPTNVTSDMSNKMMKFVYEKNDSFKASGTDTGQMRTPLYAIGFQNLKGPLKDTYNNGEYPSTGITNDDGITDNNVEISLYSVRIEITSASGNSGNNLSKVDYVYDDASTLSYFSGSSTSWDSGTWTWTMPDTNVYLSFKVITYDPNDASVLNSGISIRIVRTPKTSSWSRKEVVTVTWTGQAAYTPTDKNNIATITQG